jgi:charged multivesicular body protein 6
VHKVSTIEFSLIEVSVLHGLKQGNDVLKEIHKEMNIESVEKLLDESHEAQAYQRVSPGALIAVLPFQHTSICRKLMRCSQIISLWTMKTLSRQN